MPIARLTTAVLLAAALALPAWAADASPECVVAPDALAAGDEVSAVRIVATGRVLGEDLGISCHGPSLAGLSLSLPVGGRRDITLSAAASDWRVVDAENRVVEWAVLEASRRYPGSVVLRLSTAASDKAGHRFRAYLLQGDSTTTASEAIQIDLEVTDEQPMFRDEFGVDPVIGQFSLVL